MTRNTDGRKWLCCPGKCQAGWKPCCWLQAAIMTAQIHPVERTRVLEEENGLRRGPGLTPQVPFSISGD